MNFRKNPSIWVPLLYFTQGLPYVLVVSVSVILYKRLGLSNAEIGLYTSWLYLPWVLKPLWSPIVDMWYQKKSWYVSMQMIIALCFIIAGLLIPTQWFLVSTLACFWMVAFASATNDIATDGYYLMALSQRQQSLFVGIRSLFYRFAMLTGQGGLVVLAGYFEMKYGDNAKAWSLTMLISGILMAVLALKNWWLTPAIEEDKISSSTSFLAVFKSFFEKKQILYALAFILTYRLGESQLVKMASPFMLDDKATGGLALSTQTIGSIYGTLGVIALSTGGILGGIVISKHGLKRWMFPMLISLNLPNLCYLLLAYFQIDNLFWISTTVILEQFGYGFGFAAFLIYLMFLAEGPTKTAHYAIATGVMALGMMLPGMLSGYIQEVLGYELFFVWVLLCAIPAFLIARKLKYPETYGRKSA